MSMSIEKEPLLVKIFRPDQPNSLIIFSPSKNLSEPCAAGQYKSADKTTCEVCEEGSVSSTTGATSCTTCDPGHQANSAKTQCG